MVAVFLDRVQDLVKRWSVFGLVAAALLYKTFLGYKQKFSMLSVTYLLSSLVMRFATGADRIVLWVTRA